MAEEVALAGGAYAGDFVEDGFADDAGTAAAVEGEGEAVGFVAQALDDAEGGGVGVEAEGRGAAGGVEPEFFVFFGDAGEGGGAGEGEGVEDGAGGAELGDAAVDEDEVGEGFSFRDGALEAAAEDFGDGGGVVGAFDGLDAVGAVEGGGGDAVDGDDLGGDGVGAEGVGDVVAFHEGRGGGEGEAVGEFAEAGGGFGGEEFGGFADTGVLAGGLEEEEVEVAEDGGALEAEVGGGFAHALAEGFEEAGAAAVEEGAGFFDELGVALGGAFADAGGGAEADYVLEAVAVVGFAGDARGAGTDADVLFDEFDGGAGAGGGGVGAPVAGAVFLAEADGGEARKGGVAHELDEEEALVVLELDVVVGFVLLDEARLGEGGFLGGAEDDEVEVVDGADEAAELGVGAAEGGGAEVGGNAGAEGGGLADVDDGAGAVAHEVAAGAVGEAGELVADLLGEIEGELHSAGGSGAGAASGEASSGKAMSGARGSRSGATAISKPSADWRREGSS